MPPYELKGLSPGGHERWERESYRQWEKEYTDWYNKYYKDYDQHPSVHHRGRGSRDRDRDRERERERLSPLSRDYSPQGRARRGREDRSVQPHHPPSSSSTAAKSSSKALKTKKIKKKKSGEELEPSHQAVDRGDATPVRDEPMDEIPSPIKTPPVSSKPQAGTTTNKASASKSSAAPSKSSTKSVSKSQTDKTQKEKSQKLKAKVKTEVVKAKSDKVKKKTGDVAVTKKKDSSSSTASKPLKTVKAKTEDPPSSTAPKKERSKTSTVRPALLKTPPLPPHNPPMHLPPLHDGLRPSHDLLGRREFPQGTGLLPLPHQHGIPLLPLPTSLDGRRRMVDDGRSLLGPPPGKLRRLDGLVVGGDVLSHPHMPHQPLLHRLPHPTERPGLLSLPLSRDMSRGNIDRGVIRPLLDPQVGPFIHIHLLRKYVCLLSINADEIFFFLSKTTTKTNGKRFLNFLAQGPH